MAKKIARLTALTVQKAIAPGLYADGNGLYLRVSRGGAKAWVLRYMLRGKAREMGLGGLTKVSLADAREKAERERKLIADGVDPIDQRDSEMKRRAASDALTAALSRTFDECRDAYIRANEDSWSNAKHRQQWHNSLATYVSPIFGGHPVQGISRPLVVKALEPIWKTKPETANRVRSRIETILDFAEVKGWRSAGTNPALLGPVRMELGKRRSIKTHHPALPFERIGEFMEDLRSQVGTAALALEFLILTVARTEEVIGARPSEIDLRAKSWTIPPQRIKGRREHRVPLSSAALAVLERLSERSSEFIFPGLKVGRPLSNMAMLNLIGRMNGSRTKAELPLYVDPKQNDLEVTAHGFRSSFRDWVAERTDFPRELAEKALAHVVGDDTERAYQRGDLFERRRALMDLWAEFCAKPESQIGSVIPFREVQSA